MLLSYKRGQTSVVLRVKILDSTVTTGAGKTGLTHASSGLIISTIADNEATATAYTAAGSTIETVSTLGTYAAPTATKCRFREVDSTNHKGVYEIHLANARLAVSSAKSLLISISGATGAVETDAVVPLVDLDPYGVIAEPSGEFQWNGTVQDALAHMMVVGGGINPAYVTRSSATAGTITVRNFADNATLWTHTLTDTGSVSTRGKAT